MGEADHNRAGRDELSPQREVALLRATLRHQVGMDPDRVGPVLDLAMVGIVNSGWRNSPVEEWHAGDGPLSDGDMLRVNAHTMWRVRQIARRWRADVGLTAQSHISALDDVGTDFVDWLAARIFRWLVNPARRLPTGGTLADVAGDDLGEYTDHADGTLGGFAAGAGRHGVRYAVWRAAAHGGLACRHWWGTPTWPALVNTFLHVLNEPGHPHWGADGSRRTRLRPEPALVADRDLCGESYTTDHGSSIRTRPSGSLTRESDSSEPRYPRFPTT